MHPPLINVYSRNYTGQYAPARACLVDALRIRTAVFGSDAPHPDLAESYRLLAYSAAMAGYESSHYNKRAHTQPTYARAHMYMHSHTQVRDALRFFLHEHILFTLYNSSNANHCRHVHEAETLYLVAQRKATAVFGTMHPAVALIDSNLAWLKQQAAQYSEAEDMYVLMCVFVCA